MSAYRTDSHAAWVDWLQVAMPSFDWRVFELPGRFFRWRIRGNPLSWWGRLPNESPRLILATSMVDLATLKGLNPRLAETPAYYYFHENQFAYPLSRRQVRSIDPQMVQVYGALAAEKVLFNSAYNRDSFLDGLAQLLRQMPDAVPQGVMGALADRSEILPVPICPIAGDPQRDQRLIVWNHRWEYDKAPEVFVDAMLALRDRGRDFRLAVLGARPHEPPAELTRLRRGVGDRIVVDGKVEQAEYRRILGRAAVVVSTAIHEFQGLAVMQAVSAGCRPLVPDALCYREQYPDAYRYPVGDADALQRRLGHWLSHGLPAPVAIDAWSEHTLLPRWRRLLNAATGS